MAEKTTFEVEISDVSHDLLEQLAVKGIYGVTPSEVAARWIDAQLHYFIEKKMLIPLYEQGGEEK